MDYSCDTNGKIIDSIIMSDFKILGNNEDSFPVTNGIATKEKTIVNNSNLEQGMLVIYNPTPMYEVYLPTNTHGGIFKNDDKKENDYYPNIVINIPYKTKAKYTLNTDIYPNKNDACYAKLNEYGEDTRYYQHTQN